MDESRQVKKSLPVSEIYNRFLCNWVILRFVHFIFIARSHNDFPWTLRNYAKNQIASLNITDLTKLEPWASSPSSHTDIIRLRQGKVGAQVISII